MQWWTRLRRLGFLSHLTDGACGIMFLSVDDAVIFLKPKESEVIAIKESLALFGDTSGLKANLQKCAISPICCDGLNLDVLAVPSPANRPNFLGTYLGLPLTLVALTRGDLQSLVDSIARRWSTWKTSTVYTTGRLSLIKSVLTAITIYHMLSLELPPWLFKTVTKLCPRFFWRGGEEAKGRLGSFFWRCCLFLEKNIAR